MKGKYYQALFLVGVLPVLGLTGLFFWAILNQAPQPSPKASMVNSPALSTTVDSLRSEVQTIASSLITAIKKTHEDFPSLTAHNGDADLENFKSTHSGVSGMVVISLDGKAVKTLPTTPALVDPAYGSSDEFKNIVNRFKEKPGQTYQFYTQRLGYPAFIFAIDLPNKTIVEAAFNLGQFFRPPDPKNGEIFLLDAGSGHYFYHSIPAKMSETFNPNQEPWLTKVQTDLTSQQSGSSLSPPNSAAVYAPLGLASFGVVRVVPFTLLQPPSPVETPTPKPSLANLPEFIQTPTGMVLFIGAIVMLAWVFIVGAVFFGLILKPLRSANALILNAAEGKGQLTPEVLKKFGQDEVGQVVQASSMLIERMEKEKLDVLTEKEDALRKARAQIEEKTREAAGQVGAAQQQTQSVRNELNEKNQLLNDKLKELDALKGMSEGLRNQNEQSKTENAKLKGQISTTEQGLEEFKKKYNDAQVKFAEMESRMLQAVSASSAIHVSQVRAAAIRTMAEELKTTLGIIKGYVSSALGTAQGGINEKQQEFLGMVINRSARLEKFINDLLDVYQVEVEMEDAKREEVALATEIEGLAFNFQAQAEVKNIKIKIDAKPDVPKVPVVRRRFNQLWNILYLQIIKDAPRGSVVNITVETIGDNVKVTVPDPGLTVVPEALPKLFDEFYDPKHTASAQLAGTGLKFALVKTILGAHGGGAVAEKGDPGTRLILTFPTKIKKPGEVPPSPEIPAASASPSAPAAGVKPAGMTFGMPKSPPIPAPSASKPAMTPPGVTSPLGGPKPISFGMSKPTGPIPGAVTPGAKPISPSGSGVLDSLISGKVPPVGAAPVKPMGTPAPGTTPAIPGGMIPPKPAAPTAPGVPAAPKPPSTGFLDSLLEKKIPTTAPAAAPGTIPPKPITPGGMAPPPAPAAPKPPGLTPPAPPLGAPKPPTGSVPPMGAPKPAIPIGGMAGVLDSLLDKKAETTSIKGPGAPPPAAPKPSTPPVVPPAPPVGAPRPPQPPGMSAPPMPPKVVPTTLKPLTPPAGMLDLDNIDSMKTEDDKPKPPAPPPAPPKAPPPPGVPPGGLDASQSIKKDLNKEGEGELIE